ncbi:MAG: hypothetical protein ACJARY_002440 [Candidatus Azotimanducaceae bacterium]|jgi:hypothetical protein
MIIILINNRGFIIFAIECFRRPFVGVMLTYCASTVAEQFWGFKGGLRITK